MPVSTPLAYPEAEVTMEWQDLTAPRTEPVRTLRTMTPDDIPAALALVNSIGWQHGPALWARLLAWSPDGCFLIEEERRGVIGTVTTTPYGTALGWIGGLAVAQDRQRQGLGRRLMRAALDYLIARQTERIMLDAYAAGTGVGAWLFAHPFLTSHTAHFTLPLLGEMHLPSAIAFDLGVFLLVVGATALILIALAHQSVRSHRLPVGERSA